MHSTVPFDSVVSLLQDGLTANLSNEALEEYFIYGNRLMEIIHQCIQWREKLRWINQLYLEKIEQIQQQTKLVSTSNQMVLRYTIDAKIKQCKAKTAEFRLQTYL